MEKYMANVQELYDCRVQDIIATSNHKEPKVVPVMTNVLTWAIGYAKGNTNDLLDNLDKLPGVFTKFFEEVYCDANFMFGLTTPIRALERLGSNAFFVSSDNHTIQHREHCMMEREDYPALIENTMEFLVNTLGLRKFPELRKGREEAYRALIDAALYVAQFGAANARCAVEAREKYGIVGIIGGTRVYPTMDVVFDRLRGVSGCLTDLRRERANLMKATEALRPLYQKTINVQGTFPYAVSTLHCPMYLSSKDFNEIFWPCMRDMLLDVHKSGSKTLLFMEGAWERHFETMLNDLPQSSVLCVLEDDDVIKAKKLIGHKFTIIGGVKIHKLRFGTKQECLDEAKKIIDECAPGGGFIFSTDKSMITYDDVNVENLIAVNQFVHEYGKY
jgi:hypothetical protein